MNHINTYIGSTTLKYLKVEDIDLLPQKVKMLVLTVLPILMRKNFW